MLQNLCKLGFYTLFSWHAVFFEYLSWMPTFDAKLVLIAACSGRASSELGQGNAR